MSKKTEVEKWRDEQVASLNYLYSLEMIPTKRRLDSQISKALRQAFYAGVEYQKQQQQIKKP